MTDPLAPLLDLYPATRAVLRRQLDGLTEAQLLTVPDGFRNHIFWNVGHLVVSQQILCYRLSGLPLHVSDDLVAHFGRGTSPLDWTTTPDLAEVLGLFDTLPERMREDVAAGRFTDFTPYQTTTGPHLGSLADALAFTFFHEGLHTGVVMAQKKLVGG